MSLIEELKKEVDAAIPLHETYHEDFKYDHSKKSFEVAGMEKGFFYLSLALDYVAFLKEQERKGAIDRP